MTDNLNVTPETESETNLVKSSARTTTYSATSPEISERKKQLKKKGSYLLFFVAIAIVLITTYFFWYQNPNKVIGDALLSSVKAKDVSYEGRLTLGSTSDMVIDFSGRNRDSKSQLKGKLTFAVAEKNYSLAGESVAGEKGNLYVKIKDIGSLAEGYRAVVSEQARATIDGLIGKIDNKWVIITPDELRNLSPEAQDLQKCLTPFLTSVQNDNDVKTVLINGYKQQGFINIEEELGNKDGNIGYLLRIDEEKLASYIKLVKDAPVYEQLVKCDSRFAIQENTVDKQLSDVQSGTMRIEVWVDRWTHDLEEIVAAKASQQNTLRASIKPSFDRKEAVSIPSKAMTVKQLQTDIQSLLTPAIQP